MPTPPTGCGAGTRQGVALLVYPRARWRRSGLIFGHTEFGDLTPLFSGHFDTGIGGKKESASYRAIAGAIGIAPPPKSCSCPTLPRELAAAHEAGLQVLLLARDGLPAGLHWPAVADFTSILPRESGILPKETVA